MSGLSDTPCRDQGDLFTSTHPVDHREAAAICATCPAVDACRALARALLAGSVDQRPIGTYAGELYGGKGRPPGLPREHGTEKGYFQHRNRRETPCTPCRQAIRTSMDARLKPALVCEHHDREGHARWENKSGAESTLATSPGTSTTAPCVRGSASRAH